MSLIDDVLIAVEDQEQIGLDQLLSFLNPASRQAVFSVVGRLTKRNFLRKSSEGISITEKGKDYIYVNLDAIKKFDELDRPFLILIFEIPESQKVTREKLRAQLNQLGFGSLKRGVMLGAVTSQNDVTAIVDGLGLNDRVVLLKVESPKELMGSRFVPWRFDKINHGYQRFLDRANQLINSKQDETTRIKAKQLVLQFARASKVDPVLPKELNNRDYLGYRAHELYLKLKPLCY